MSSEDLRIFQEKHHEDGDSAKDVGKRNKKPPVVDHNVNHITSTQAVNLLTYKFIEVFAILMEAEPRGRTQTVLMYEYLKEKMFYASTAALMGPKIFDLNPGFNETYWKFDAAFLPLLYGLPFPFSREHKNARDTLFEADMRWAQSAWKGYDWSKGDDPEWEEHFGSRAVRTRHEMWKQGGSSMGAAVSLDMGLLFG
jgi:hypothetical protein